MDFENLLFTGKAEIFMKKMPDSFIDLTITSPPYSNIRSYKGKVKEEISYSGYSFPFENIATQLYRITKNGGIVIWVVNDQYINGGRDLTSFKQALYFQELGFLMHDCMIYHKNGAAFPSQNRYYQVYEYMFVLSKGKPKTVNLFKDKVNRWAGYTNFGTPSKRKHDGELEQVEKFKVADFGVRYNVWYIANGSGYSTKDKIAYKHPAIFPESLAEDHILSWSNEGDIVLDPMCGSGTTCKMAYINNRKFIGIDINKEYIEISNERIASAIPYGGRNQNKKLEKLYSAYKNSKKIKKNERKST